MNGIEFNNDISPQQTVIQERLPTMIRFVMKFGISDPEKANYILLVLSFTAIVISVFLFIFPGSSKTDLKPIIHDRNAILIQMQSHRN